MEQVHSLLQRRKETKPTGLRPIGLLNLEGFGACHNGDGVRHADIFGVDQRGAAA